jgi:hypothetical protein
MIPFDGLLWKSTSSLSPCSTLKQTKIVERACMVAVGCSLKHPAPNPFSDNQHIYMFNLELPYLERETRNVIGKQFIGARQLERR